MKKTNKVFVLMIASLLILAFSVAAISGNNISNPYVVPPVASGDVYLGELVNKVQTRDGRTRITHSLTDSQQIQERLRQSGSPLYGTEVSELITVSSFDGQQYMNFDSYNLGPRRIFVTRRTQNTYYSDRPIRSSSYVYPGGTMTVTDSVAVTFHATVDVTKDFLTTQLGFSHTSTHSVSDAQNVIVPVGKRANVTAWVYYELIEYNIFRDPLILTGFPSQFEGTGWSARPSGVRFEIAIF